jgi:hypothetical protein
MGGGVGWGGCRYVTHTSRRVSVRPPRPPGPWGSPLVTATHSTHCTPPPVGGRGGGGGIEVNGLSEGNSSMRVSSSKRVCMKRAPRQGCMRSRQPPHLLSNTPDLSKTQTCIHQVPPPSFLPLNPPPLHPHLLLSTQVLQPLQGWPLHCSAPQTPPPRGDLLIANTPPPHTHTPPTHSPLTCRCPHQACSHPRAGHCAAQLLSSRCILDRTQHSFNQRHVHHHTRLWVVWGV